VAIRITRIDDIDGTEGAEATTLELDHKAYEIDLCARNRVRLIRVIRPFIERARLVDSDESRSPGEIPRSSVGGRKCKASSNDDGAGRMQTGSGTLDIIEMAREVRD
jgi:hypothetical protein